MSIESLIDNPYLMGVLEEKIVNDVSGSLKSDLSGYQSYYEYDNFLIGPIEISYGETSSLKNYNVWCQGYTYILVQVSLNFTLVDSNHCRFSLECNNEQTYNFPTYLNGSTANVNFIQLIPTNGVDAIGFALNCLNDSASGAINFQSEQSYYNVLISLIK